MAVTNSDIAHLQSSVTASAGGAITASGITSGAMNNVWPDISDALRIAGTVIYRKTFIKNNHATDSLLTPSVYISSPPTSATLVLGLGINSADDADTAQGNMSAWSGTGVVALVSSTVGDSRVATIYGLDNTGTPVPVTEAVALNGTTEVLSLTVFSKVWAVFVDSLDASRTVTVRQGSGGTARGSIGVNKKSCWLWVAATSKGAGIYLPSLAPGQNYGVWRKLTVSAGASAVRPNSLTVSIEENV